MLENCSPADVFYYFEQISSIPRGSGNSRQIADYIEAFAGDRGLYCERDAYDNVIIKKPGTALLEDAPAVMLSLIHILKIIRQTHSHGYFVRI